MISTASTITSTSQISGAANIAVDSNIYKYKSCNFRHMGGKEKRGQISIFFMIGIAIIVVLLIVIYLRSEDIKIDNAVVIPPMLLPAKSYLDFCLDSTVKSGFEKLGRQAGFVTMPPDMKMNPARKVNVAGIIDVVPYWYYDNKNWIPSQEYIEDEMANYIIENFLACINSVDYTLNGLILRPVKKNATAKVSINEKDVSVELYYPMEISLMDGSISTKINGLFKRFNIRLKDMMSLAKYILEYENANYFLENITIGLISINDEIPLSGMIMKCGVDTWYITNIKQALQESLLDTFQNIRVEGTDYFPFQADESIYEAYKDYGYALKDAYEKVTLVDNFDQPEDYENAINAEVLKAGAEMPDEDLPPDAYYYFHYFMPMDTSYSNADSNKYENFSVDFVYLPQYGMEMQAKPSSDGVLKSNSAKGASKYLSFLCINLYHFVYDVTYPVVITLNDPDALNGQGYMFRFAIPVLIRNNEGLRSKQQMTFMPSRGNYENYCIGGPGKKAYIRAYDTAQGSTTPIEGVNISMVCANKKCNLGTTRKIGGDAVLKTNLTDSCSNPYLVAEKEGYFMGVTLVEDMSDDVYYIEMTQLKNFTVNVKKHRLNLADNTTGPAIDVSDGNVDVYISGFIGEKPYDDYFVIDSGKQNIIQLPVGDSEYDLSLTYLKNSEDFSGGYYTTWNVTKDQLLRGNTITLHVIELLVDVLDEDAANSIGLLYNISKAEFQPTIS